eukprot:TRINITY_DN8996_c0_g1_i1.p1 TRINITY_DN8996_c0_g1~~TRINITY_DN8996_c0_g1_i1.p1  ORF type:complete len:435 (-),score=60.66 TRINITY_DN8996_c0_g1_i1:51-1355(-)
MSPDICDPDLCPGDRTLQPHTCSRVVQVFLNGGRDSESYLYEVSALFEQILRPVIREAVWTDLLESAERGDARRIRLIIVFAPHRLLQLGSTDHPLGESALMAASTNGRTEVVGLLLEAGVKFETSWTSSRAWQVKDTCLLAAIKNKHPQVVRLLIAAGADVQVNDGQFAALVNAVLCWHPEVIQMLLEAGAGVGEQVSSALYWSSQVSNATGYDHGTRTLASPLAVACGQGHLRIVRMLLEAGATEHLHKGNALHSAARHGHVEVLKCLLENSSGIPADVLNHKMLTEGTPLMAAARHGHPQAVEALAQAHADVNLTQFITGRTAIMTATADGHASVVTALIAAGADVCLLDHHDRSCLMLAVKGSKADIADQLAAAGADVHRPEQASACHPDGQTPLMVAASTGDAAMIEVLLRHGALVQPPSVTYLLHWSL